MKTHQKNILRRGFTIIELLVVISIIGILVTVVVVSYNGVQASARDKSLLSDLDALDGQETNCGLNKTSCGIVSTLAAKAWYSPNGIDSYLQFTPSPGNVIDIVVNSTDYCIRGYNLTAATYTKISLAATKESTTGACATLAASASAIAGSP
jgi:prepilin-type N-terminal cleavage/methylation domain-containing protein